VLLSIWQGQFPWQPVRQLDLNLGLWVTSCEGSSSRPYAYAIGGFNLLVLLVGAIIANQGKEISSRFDDQNIRREFISIDTYNFAVSILLAGAPLCGWVWVGVRRKRVELRWMGGGRGGWEGGGGGRGDSDELRTRPEYDWIRVFMKR
jgi:hypothetical protein